MIAIHKHPLSLSPLTNTCEHAAASTSQQQSDFPESMDELLELSLLQVSGQATCTHLNVASNMHTTEWGKQQFNKVLKREHTHARASALLLLALHQSLTAE